VGTRRRPRPWLGPAKILARAPCPRARLDLEDLSSRVGLGFGKDEELRRNQSNKRSAGRGASAVGAREEEGERGV
jgi:hypothetical protein